MYNFEYNKYFSNQLFFLSTIHYICVSLSAGIAEYTDYISAEV